MAQQPIAVADLGSNTLHLLIAAVEGGHVRPLLDESEMVRLGDDVDRTGVISDEKADIAVSVVRRFQHHAQCFGAGPLQLLATQGVRIAGNREAFLARIAAETGLATRVLTVEEEAQLAFDGVVLSTRYGDCAGRLADRFLVLDVGGGSTQLVLGQGERLLTSRSLPIGSGKMTTLHVRHDPPLAEELRAVAVTADAALATLDREFLDTTRPSIALGVGGSAKAVRRLANLPLAGQPIPLSRVRQMVDTVQRQNAASIANAFEITRPRAAVLPAGLVVIERVLTHFGLNEISVKTAGIRDGAVLRLARGVGVAG